MQTDQEAARSEHHHGLPHVGVPHIGILRYSRTHRQRVMAVFTLCSHGFLLVALVRDGMSMLNGATALTVIAVFIGHIGHSEG